MKELLQILESTSEDNYTRSQVETNNETTEVLGIYIC